MKRVLLTGASGTIGSALVPRLLGQADTTLQLLIRATDPQALQARFDGLLDYWGYAHGGPEAARLSPLLGDISMPDFGLQPGVVQDLVATTTHLVHCAASVKLNMSAEQARATAVQPTRTVLSLARRGLQAGALHKVDLVSTVGVWGCTPGHMPERRLPEVSIFHNTYEAAKAEAERVVWAEGDGLPITVHRPSMVVGQASDGRVINFQVFYHLCEFLSGARTFGIMPALGHTRLDTVPVDWVADAIAWSVDHPETAGHILHLCSGPDRAIALPQLQDAVRLAWRQHGRRVPRLWQVKRSWLERLIPLIGALAGQKAQRALRGLPPVLAYLAEDQGFLNSQTLLRLEAAGLPLPRIEQYLAPVLDHYLRHQPAPGRP